MDFKLIGSPCGQHGPYTFYKAFKYSKHGKTNILALSEFFFVKLWNDSDLVSIGELQLLWEDKNSEQTLASLRLYILPENTPEGRSDCHGEHEVLAITEKVVLRLEDLLTWITEAADWSWGLSAVYDQRARLMPRPDSTFDLSDVDKEKDLLDSSHWETRSGVVVLSFPRYCRYRGVLKRLEGVQNHWLREALVVALGGFTVPCRNTRVLYCKETFDYPDLEGHELLCNHLAPKLKGRPRKKRKLDRSPDSSDSESESSSVSTSSSSTKFKIVSSQKSLSLVRSNSLIQGSRRVARVPSCSTVEKDFLSRLFSYMRSRQTPISRVPTIGFKELDLYKLFTKVCNLGGYDAVTSSRLWKYVYEEMGGDQSSTSAATCCRRHYERLLLPYERHVAPNRSKNATLAKLKRFQDISITSKPTSSYGKSRILPIKNGNLKTTGSDTRPPREKENIPQSRSYSSEIIDLDSDTSPNKDKNDVIDLVSESDDSQSPNKMKALPSSLSPKKQKLEILKEGGLEVTPVSKGTNGRPPVSDKPRLTEKPRPSVIQQAKNPSEHQGKSRPSKEKVSITITPDVSHMLPNNRHAWSLGGHSVYGNPKDVVQPRARTNTEEILDLTTKSPYAPVGSNLEITLVPPSSSATQIRGKRPQSVQTTARSNTQKHYQSSQQRLVPKPVLRVPSPVTSISNGRGSGIVPSVSISVNPAAPLDKRRSSGSNSYPVMDPVYLSAFYSGLFTPPQLQMYKELLHRHNVPDSFPRLLQDGSTSISLVDRSHSRSNPSK